MAKSVNKSDVAKALATGSNHLGGIVMWTLRGAVMKADDLKALFAKHGLDWGVWGKADITGQSAFRRAVRTTKQELAGTGVLIRPIDSSGTEIVLGIVDEQRLKQTKDLKYSLLCRVTYDKANEAVKTDDSGLAKDKQNKIGRRIKTLYASLRDYYITQDFINICCKAMRSGLEAINMRETGGVYFVPAAHDEDLMKLRAIINEVGQSVFSVLPVWDDPQAKEDIGRQVKMSLAEELQDLQEKIEEFKTEPPRRDTLKNRLELFQDLRAKAAMYSNMLSVKVDDLEDGIEQCEETLKGLLKTETERLEAVKSNKTSKGKKKRKAKSVSEAVRRIRKIAGEADFEELVTDDEDLGGELAEAPRFEDLVAEANEGEAPEPKRRVVIVDSRKKKTEAKGKKTAKSGRKSKKTAA